jgi:hypothetical protein
MFRLTSFLRRARGIDRATFVERWRGELSAAILANPHVARSVRSYVRNLPFATIPEEFMWIAADDFDGVAELWFDTIPGAVATANALASDPAIQAITSQIIDTAGSMSWIGHVVDDFDKPGIAVKRIVAGQPRADMPLEEAQDYWIYEHNAFFSQFKDFMAYMLRYRAVYGIQTPSLRIASQRFMGMCADVGFASLQDLSDAYREPKHAAVMMTDIVKFGATSGAITFTAADVEIGYGRPLG